MQNREVSQCAKCKGVRMLCGRSFCPLLRKQVAMEKAEKQLVNLDLLGSTSSVFVGSQNYPKLNVGAMSSVEIVSDNPEKMFGSSLKEIIDERLQLFRAKDPMKTTQALNPDKHLETLQEVAMAQGNVFSDTEFKRKPKFEMTFSAVHQPFGPTAQIKNYSLESNPKISNRIEKVVDDDLKSMDQMKLLYERHAPVSSISKILSVGLLGFAKKLVPTKWSITATDDTLGKDFLKEVKDYREFDEYWLYQSQYLGNDFQIMFIPGNWSYDIIECMGNDSLWSGNEEVFNTDHETHKGRTKYAENVAGGYYAARLGVLEELKDLKRQATVIIARRIHGDYHIPVGVWQVRENVRNAFRNKPEKFQTLNEMLEVVDKRIGMKWQPHSEILKTVMSREILKKYLV